MTLTWDTDLLKRIMMQNLHTLYPFIIIAVQKADKTHR